MRRWILYHGDSTAAGRLEERFRGRFDSCAEALEFAEEYSKTVDIDDYLFVTNGTEEHVLPGRRRELIFDRITPGSANPPPKSFERTLRKLRAYFTEIADHMLKGDIELEHGQKPWYPKARTKDER